ncbi:LacI family transcriptional regulator, partial [Streptomyces sp. NPDC047841]
LVLELGSEREERAATRVELATSLVVRSSTDAPPAA